MTLRTRLVVALMALAMVGLSVFGAATYTLYRKSQRQQLDDQLQATAQGQASRLAREALTGSQDGATVDCSGAATFEELTPGPAEPGSAPEIPVRPSFGPATAGAGLDAYSELRSADGQTIACNRPLTTDARPDLALATSDLLDIAAGQTKRLLTASSTDGDVEWRVFVVTAELDPAILRTAEVGQRREGFRELRGSVAVIALPTTSIDDSMRRLLRIELAAALVLLSALGAGAWLILRKGLRPLEQMANSASSITAGDLSQRVDQSRPTTEVGELGLALNTMLDGIETSFKEREATEARLRQFLSDAAHELRTPLTSIQGFAELFRLHPEVRSDGVPTREVDLPVIMRRIEQESDRMAALVEDLLLLARLDETRPFTPEPVDLAVLAADACSDLAALGPRRPITLDAPTAVVISGDEAHLRQAIANLIANVARHTQPSVAVDVSAEIVAAPTASEHVQSTSPTARISVRDHGDGLSTEAMAHVFDRFWQADAARVGAGSGLGLSIVAAVAAEHKGRAFVKNHPDGGAVFTIELPA